MFSVAYTMYYLLLSLLWVTIYIGLSDVAKKATGRLFSVFVDFTISNRKLSLTLAHSLYFQTLSVRVV